MDKNKIDKIISPFFRRGLEDDRKAQTSGNEVFFPNSALLLSTLLEYIFLWRKKSQGQKSPQKMTIKFQVKKK